MRISGNSGGNNSRMQTGADWQNNANLQTKAQTDIRTEQHTGTHRVTDCIHDHNSELYGGVRITIEAGNTVQQNNVPVMASAEGGFSLGAWISNALSGVKRALGGIWNGAGDAGTYVASGMLTEDKTNGVVADDKPDGMAEDINLEKGVPSVVTAVVATGVQSPKDLVNNPYFSAISDTGKESETLWQRVKVKFHSVASNLTNRFSFFGKNSFQTRQEQSKEDLRKRSHYKDDELEIDCMLTDDSYLLDSYDRKGEYSKLSAKK